MKKFIIRLQDGNYVMNVRLTSNYLDYDRTGDRENQILFLAIFSS